MFPQGIKMVTSQKVEVTSQRAFQGLCNYLLGRACLRHPQLFEKLLNMSSNVFL